MRKYRIWMATRTGIYYIESNVNGVIIDISIVIIVRTGIHFRYGIQVEENCFLFHGKKVFPHCSEMKRYFMFDEFWVYVKLSQKNGIFIRKRWNSWKFKLFLWFFSLCSRENTCILHTTVCSHGFTIQCDAILHPHFHFMNQFHLTKWNSIANISERPIRLLLLSFLTISIGQKFNMLHSDEKIALKMMQNV